MEEEETMETQEGEGTQKEGDEEDVNETLKWSTCVEATTEPDPSKRTSSDRSKTLNTNRLTVTRTFTQKEGEEEEVNETLKGSRVKKTKVEE